MTKPKLIPLLLLLVSVAQAQPSNPAPTTAGSKPPLKSEELEQLLAPIALYPDSLLTQMLMASTYPLEIVEADRWVKAHKDLKGDSLATELEKQTWDASVKSLVNFPEVLSTMSEKLDTTMKLGDAFIGQQADVMNAVQVLRVKAQKQGNLKSDQNVKVASAPAPAAPAAGAAPQITVVQAPPQVITIESASPQVVYVPTYEPTVVYGAWPYPTYPPYPYYPPRPAGWVVSNAISFGVGVACGAAWGYAWGHCNWGHNDIDIDVNRNVNFNTHIDRNKYQTNINARQNNIGGRGGTWQHDPAHRDGVPYRDQASAQRFGGADQTRTAQARQQFRGQADAGRQNLARDQQSGRFNNVGGNQPGNIGGQNRGIYGGNNQAGNIAGQSREGGLREGNQPSNIGGQSRDLGGDRGGGLQNRGGGGADALQNRSGGSSGTRSGAFEGANRSGNSTRAASQRGQASRSGGGGGRLGGRR
ncbi:MAG TPA: DUF3300 domain-containing protein [Tepidisphaeraceae bacterium]|nr:DUF3300 domain-containing protein [Tepidisphaeraceae bacterium]